MSAPQVGDMPAPAGATRREPQGLDARRQPLDFGWRQHPGRTGADRPHQIGGPEIQAVRTGIAFPAGFEQHDGVLQLGGRQFEQGCQHLHMPPVLPERILEARPVAVDDLRPLCGAGIAEDPALEALGFDDSDAARTEDDINR